MQSIPLYYYFPSECVYTRARKRILCIWLQNPTVRPSVWTMNAREPACLCACAGLAGATHTHALLSRRATGNISSIPENAAAAAAMEASAPAGLGERCAREGHCGRACVECAERGVCQTPGGGPVCLDARHADHPSSPKHHSTHHPVHRHSPPPDDALWLMGQKIAFTTDSYTYHLYLPVLYQLHNTH